MIKFYELHDYCSPPFERVADFLKTENKSQKDVLKDLGINSTEYENYLKGRQDITKEFSKKLGDFFGINEDYFLKLQELYNRNKEIYDKEKTLFDSIKKVIKSIPTNIKDNSLDIMCDIFDYYKSSNIEEACEKIKEHKNVLGIQFRTTDKIDENHLSFWLQYGNNKYDEIVDKKAYSKSGLESFLSNKSNYIKYLNNPEDHADLFNDFVNVMSNLGVFIIETPKLIKTPFGATRWIDTNPIIQVSPKTNYYDNFWFTIFHELGHVILHQNQNIIDFDDTVISKQENEANKFALDKIFGINYNDCIVKETYMNEAKFNEYCNKYFQIDKSFIIGQVTKSLAFSKPYVKFSNFVKNRAKI
jgi:HTH-type transcriptional regulator/antitoxin HigA